VAFGDDAVVAVAVVVVHDGQALHEVEPVSLGERGVGQLAPAGGRDGVALQGAAGIAVGRQARGPDEVCKGATIGCRSPKCRMTKR
jgi:hypothetical protein